MMSRGRRPSMATISSPGWRPARAAGDPAATATTRGRDIARPGYWLNGVTGRRLCHGPGQIAWWGGRGEGAAGLAPRVLRRRRDGHQGPGVDDPGVRAARLLLPRDCAQPGGGGALPGTRRDLRR